MPVVIQQGYRAAIGFEKLTVSSTPKALTATVYNPTATVTGSGAIQHFGGEFALVTVEDAPIRLMFKQGTTVTTAIGHLLNVGDSYILEGVDNIRNARFIAVSGDGTIQVTYFGS